MSPTRNVSRRQFLGASAAVLAIPTIIPRSVFGANEKVVTGHVGVGGQGVANLKNFLNLTQPAALCDVDKEHLAAATKLVSGACEGYNDYRRLLDRKDIDAVVVSTPDHWHALVTVHACQAGKDVYCEKPLTLTVAEGRKMVEAARQNRRIVQTGSQQRSDVRFHQACDLVRSGKIGKVQEVLVGIPAVNFKGEPVADSQPPAELDYDRWIGPAPMKPYNERHVHYNFRFFWDYSGGQMTNFGAHHLDIAQWALGMDNSGPVAVEGAATFDSGHIYEVTKSCRVTYTYEDGTRVVVGQEHKEIPQGVTFIGTEGRIFVDRKKITAEPKEIVGATSAEKGKYPDMSMAHKKNFLDCVKSRELPAGDVEIGHRSATVCHLGNIAARLGRKLRWDPSAERIVGDVEASGWLDRPKRAPYML